MVTENLSTLKIHKLSQAQYDREFEAGNIDENALYLTPDEEIDLSGYATKDELSAKADFDHTHEEYATVVALDTLSEEVTSKADTDHTHINSSGGFAMGTDASAGTGGAIGKESSATLGGAVGHQTETTWGGAVGYGAISTNGFSGGYNAQATVNAIQLGAGTNETEKSLQVYGKQLMNGDGYIPLSRLICHSETLRSVLSAGTTYATFVIAKTWNSGIPIVRSVSYEDDEGSHCPEPIMYTILDCDNCNELRIRVQRPTGVATSSEINYALQLDVIGV